MGASVRLVAARVPGWGAPAGVGAIGATALGLIAALDPATRGAWTAVCPFRALTGLDCPGCGGTRAVYAMTQGDLALALDHNLVAVILVPLLALVWGVWFVRRLRHGRAGRAPLPPAAVSMGIAAMLTLFWVVRNLPWMPFAWLGSPASG